MLTERQSSTRALPLTVGILCLGHFFVDLMLGIWPVYKTMAGLDLAVAGLIAGVSAFIGEGLQMLFGSLSDRGYRKLMILSGVIMTTASSLFAYSDNYFLLFIFYLTTCIGSGAFHPSGAGLMGTLTTQRKSLFIAGFTACGAFGMAISQLVFTQVFTLFSGHVSVLGFLPLALVALAVIGAFDAKDSLVKDEAQSTKGHFGEYFRLFRNRDMLWLYLTQLCNATLFWGTMFLLPDLLHSREYDAWISFGGGHMFYIMGAAVLMIAGGYLADLYSSRMVILVSTVLGMGLFYFILLNPMLSDAVLLGALFLLGAVVGSVNPIVVAFGNRLMPQNPSTVSAFLMGLVWCIAECLGPGGGGLLTKLFVDDAPAKALGILGIFFGIGFAVALPLPKGVYAESDSKSEYASENEF